MKINTSSQVHTARGYEAPRAEWISLDKPLHLLRRFSVVEMDIDDFIDGEDL